MKHKLDPGHWAELGMSEQGLSNVSLKPGFPTFIHGPLNWGPWRWLLKCLSSPLGSMPNALSPYLPVANGLFGLFPITCHCLSHPSSG